LKTIGLLGGMSWESTVTYYQILNREAQKRLGGVHSAKIVMHSVDFAELNALLLTGDWDGIAARLSAAGKDMVQAGAEFLLICTNTMHKVADEVAQGAGVPLLHICDCTAAKIKAAGLKRVALLGTAYTMEQDFYRDRLAGHGLDVIVPEAPERAELQRIIFEELVCGRIEPASRETCRRIVVKLADAGAEGVILGCTELPLLVRAEDSPAPLFDTTELHALAAADLALS
jgi:aspartate racemase